MLSPLIDYIENFLVHYYRFAPLASAQQFLVTSEELRAKLPGSAKVEDIISQEGAVVYVAEPSPLHDHAEEDDVFLGIYLSDRVRVAVGAADPLIGVKEGNLEALLVAVEEISHFHLLVNRLHHGRPVTHLELEWQGEIDKYLLAAHLMADQCGDHALHPLAVKLFENVHFTNAGKGSYEEANFQAARFWFRWISHQTRATQLIHSRELNQLLRDLYRLPWHEKMHVLDQPQLLAS